MVLFNDFIDNSINAINITTGESVSAGRLVVSKSTVIVVSGLLTITYITPVWPGKP